MIQHLKEFISGLLTCMSIFLIFYGFNKYSDFIYGAIIIVLVSTLVIIFNVWLGSIVLSALGSLII